jgi:hypothetical protein
MFRKDMSPKILLVFLTVTGAFCVFAQERGVVGRCVGPEPRTHFGDGDLILCDRQASPARLPLGNERVIFLLAFCGAVADVVTGSVQLDKRAVRSIGS